MVYVTTRPFTYHFVRGETELRSFDLHGITYYCIQDLCIILSLKTIPGYVSNKVVAIKSQWQELKMIPKNAVVEMLSRNRRCDSKTIERLSRVIGVGHTVINIENHETKWCEFIKACFPTIQFVREYPVGSYRIDLYSERYKLAIEIDERGHEGYESDVQRQRSIEDSLGCVFVRINPDCKGFRIENVIGRISTLILNQTK